jgi:hypothetical protein
MYLGGCARERQEPRRPVGRAGSPDRRWRQLCSQHRAIWCVSRQIDALWVVSIDGCAHHTRIRLHPGYAGSRGTRPLLHDRSQTKWSFRVFCRIHARLRCGVSRGLATSRRTRTPWTRGGRDRSPGGACVSQDWKRGNVCGANSEGAKESTAALGLCALRRGKRCSATRATSPQRSSCWLRKSRTRQRGAQYPKFASVAAFQHRVVARSGQRLCRFIAQRSCDRERPSLAPGQPCLHATPMSVSQSYPVSMSLPVRQRNDQNSVHKEES